MAVLIPKNITTSLAKQDLLGSYMWVTGKLWFVLHLLESACIPFWVSRTAHYGRKSEKICRCTRNGKFRLVRWQWTDLSLSLSWPKSVVQLQVTQKGLWAVYASVNKIQLFNRYFWMTNGNQNSMVIFPVSLDQTVPKNIAHAI